eukprot:9331998-Heterocapsa_arctica.AAC.1
MYDACLSGSDVCGGNLNECEVSNVCAHDERWRFKVVSSKLADGRGGRERALDPLRCRGRLAPSRRSARCRSRFLLSRGPPRCASCVTLARPVVRT